MEGYDHASKWYHEKQRGTVLCSEATSLVSYHMTYNPSRWIALSHRIMYIRLAELSWRRGCSIRKHLVGVPGLTPRVEDDGHFLPLVF